MSNIFGLIASGRPVSNYALVLFHDCNIPDSHIYCTPTVNIEVT